MKCDSYENYPTFQLFLQTIVKEVDLLLKEKEGDELVWNRLVWLPGNRHSEIKSDEVRPGAAELVHVVVL